MSSRSAEKPSFEEILKRNWGYDSFRPMQREIIEAACGGQDLLALMPTGGGKSILYQLSALAMEGVCIVVTPLVALMKDQVDRLRKMGISAAALHAGVQPRQIDLILDNASWGDLKLLYVSPERLGNHTFRERIRGMKISLIAVDEAHCISQWGYDFRPSYLRIAELREHHPDTPILALTASATDSVVDDIMRSLNMSKQAKFIRSSFARPNLSFSVRETDDKITQLLRIIKNVPGSGIVYVRSREQAEKIAEELQKSEITALGYHAGMTYSQRSERQERWKSGGVRVMVSTNAFGMGIDKADVRFVVHYDIPSSLEAYYQEAGRAGRDNRIAYCVLLTSSDDRARMIKRFHNAYPTREQISNCYEALFNYLQVGYGEGMGALLEFNVYEFAAFAKIYVGTARNALKFIEQNGYIALTDGSENPPRIVFSVNRDDLYHIKIASEEMDNFIRTILRLYTGLFGLKFIAIDQEEIAHAANITTTRVKELLKELWSMNIIKYIPKSNSPILTLYESRYPTDQIYISPESYQLRREIEQKRAECVFDYAESTTCRSSYIRSYFGDETEQQCGICDNCLANRKRGKGGNPAVRRQILDSLNKHGKSVKELVGSMKLSPETAVEEIDALLEEGIIVMREEGKIGIKE